MARWNVVAMGQAGLSDSMIQVARPVAGSIARRTGRSEDEILSLIGAAILAMTLISFIRTVSHVIKAGRTGVQRPGEPAARR